MMPQGETDYKKLFSELIKKQMLVLGPDITLAKVKNVIGLTVDVNGDVIKLEGDPQQMLQGLINQFVELSGMIVKKTMESILTSYPGMMAMATSGAFGGGIQVSTNSNPAPTSQAATSGSESHEAAVASSNPSAQQIQMDAPTASSHSEPPPMTSVHFEGLSAKTEAENKSVSGPQPFSSQEMQDLNKALEELANAPLSSENQPTAQASPSQ
jgi:cobalamin biosynthesis Mg chelatase CobN